MRRVRSTLSDSDNIAISVQVQLELDLLTGTELGKTFGKIRFGEHKISFLIKVQACCEIGTKPE